ncbi:MAG TPA: methyltransferase domain-containing protein [Alphaproteobacteria bacterium]|jgi:SAM-dependent methyltransferase|nr:methyltransferase domain-containing protein [Alphaproteobacteria bacterium]
MEQAEYELMATVEDRMWWYHGLHTLAAERFVAARGKAPLPVLPALDGGCGTGGLLTRLSTAAPDATLVGIEYAPPAAAMARAKSGRGIVIGTVNSLPFADAAFGAMFSMDVLCHRAVDEDRALAEAHRCLAPGGVLIVNLPAYRWMLSSHDTRVHNVRRYTRREVVDMLGRAGFARVWASYWNTLLFPMMVLKRKLLGGEASDVHPFPAPVEFLFRSVLAIERAVLALGLRFPFGGSILAVAVKP